MVMCEGTQKVVARQELLGPGVVQQEALVRNWVVLWAGPWEVTQQAKDMLKFPLIHFPFVPNLEHRAPVGVSVITLTLRHTVGLLWTSDQSIAENVEVLVRVYCKF
jgi:hypothetical protein